MNKIFAFWESKDQKIPAYLELCKLTWERNIPNVEIHILNHSNLQQYIGNTYDIEKLKQIPLPMQSDIVSAAVLEKFGGIFLDLDCIVTDNIFDYLKNLSADKLIGFGYPGKGIHLAVLYAQNSNNFILKTWREAAQKKLNNLPENFEWDYFGNSIINPMLQSIEHKNKFLIIDRTESGNILESKILLNSTWKNSKEYYENFYFNPYIQYKGNVLDFVNCGIISLHNSWTPKDIKNENNIEKFLKLNLPISQILKDALSRNNSNNNNDFILRVFYEEKFKKLNFSNIVFRKIKKILVIDSTFNGINYAFDLTVENNLIHLDFIVRNNEKVLNLIKNKNIIDGGQFNNNKVRILSNQSDKDKVFEFMLDILNKIKLLS